MKNVILSVLILIALGSCSEDEPEVYTGQTLEYAMFKASDFDYNGTLTVKEMRDGNLQLDLQLVGESNNSGTTFPAHLHHGDYSNPDAPMAFMLNPVSGSDLKSTTVLGPLINGEKLSFEGMKTFDGHVKVHLANEGPDYKVILVAGGIGANLQEPAAFDAAQMSICSQDF
ncbi:hypothetical protein LZF95_07830 [Algoriphagus sp. AGSA1]|uniref:hypothetical protein n=1 Tax=Algoriphagus sp. AGSA1 TaxID=2907213 RepID=UPI001F369C82|nr:hypothetical protein [Algoriphagus sp. AGSA1]MCE7054579.1 hypothetical protein [Algoriphagus sp. AGSA1]